MAFYFNSRVATSGATTQAASTFILNTNDSIEFSVAAVDQETLQTEINDAVMTSVQDIVDDLGGGVLNEGPLGGILKDVNGEFGQYGDLGSLDLGGAGGIAESIGGIAMPDRIDSAADLLGWAEGMMDPNRVDMGSTNGDPLRQSGGSRDMPGNINVNGGGGEGKDVAKTTVKDNGHGSNTIKVGKGEVAQWSSTDDEGNGVRGTASAGSTVTGLKDTVVYVTKSGADGKPHLISMIDIDEKGNAQVLDNMGHLLKNVPVMPYTEFLDPEGEGNGGIDGGNTPMITGDGGTGDYQGDLGEIYLNLGIGTSGGDGQVNSSLEDFMDAIGGVTPSGAPANEGGQGEGADGNTDGGPVLPPYYVEHHAVLHGAVIDPIPYII
jgi:hypothetical protein